MLNKKKFLIFIFVLLVVLPWFVLFSWPNQRLHFIACNVGQGDAILITKGSNQVLIDGGPNNKVLSCLSENMPFWDRTIDLIILTHPEHDHMAGLMEVLKSYEVKNVLWTGVVRDNAEYKEWLDLIGQEGAKIEIAKSGQKVRAGDVCFNVLYPLESLEGQEIKNTNNTSIVGRLTFGNNSFLFTGDALKSVEKKLIDEKAELNSDVLKVGHHGSKTSSGDDFIREVSPEVAVIQVGRDNHYGHPHQETLETFKKYDIKVLRTDIDGDIKIVSDGENYQF